MATTTAQTFDRGHAATGPRQIPGKGWKDILWRVKEEIGNDNLSIVSAGVAFYALLAIFPGLTALISIYGLIADPVEVQQQITAISNILPESAQDILNQQLTGIVQGSNAALGIGVVIGILGTLWSAAKGVKTLMSALNIVYREKETRNFIKMTVSALALTAGSLIFSAVALGLIVALPALMGNLGLQQMTQTLMTVLRWPLLVVFIMFLLAVIYRYGPDRSQAKWRWVSWGAAIATILWIFASWLFSYYVSHFGSYNETYGSLGAIVILLMWFYLSAFIVLIGAELNAEMEHQTSRDTTTGKPKPIGERGAHMADHVANMASTSSRRA